MSQKLILSWLIASTLIITGCGKVENQNQASNQTGNIEKQVLSSGSGENKSEIGSGAEIASSGEINNGSGENNIDENPFIPTNSSRLENYKNNIKDGKIKGVEYEKFMVDYEKIKNQDKSLKKIELENHGKYSIIIGDNYIFANSIEPMPFSDAKSFEKINDWHYKDKNHVYEYSCFLECNLVVFEKADPKTFQIVNKYYKKDKNNVFVSSNKILEGADPKTFEIIDGYYAKDKNNFYYLKKVFGPNTEEIGIVNVSGGKIVKKLTNNVFQIGNDIYSNFTYISVGGYGGDEFNSFLKKTNFISNVIYSSGFSYFGERNFDNLDYLNLLFTKDYTYFNYKKIIYDDNKKTNLFGIIKIDKKYNLEKSLDMDNFIKEKLLELNLINDTRSDDYDAILLIKYYYSLINEGKLKEAYERTNQKIDYASFEKMYKSSQGKTEIIYGPLLKEGEKDFYTLVKIEDKFYFVNQEIIDGKINTKKVYNPIKIIDGFFVFDEFIVDFNNYIDIENFVMIEGKFKENTKHHQDMKYSFEDKDNGLEFIIISQ